MKQVILIFGPGRSGTSLVARLISELGADLGENLIEGNKSNPDGYFEDREIVAIHKKLLGIFTPADSYGATLPLPKDWLGHEAVAETESRLRSHTEKKLLDHDRIAIKDPRISMLLPIWQRVAKSIGVDLKCVICIRHPAAMAASQEKATMIPIPVSEAMWLTCTAYAFDYLQNDGVIVDFEAMISSPTTSVKRICNYVAGEDHYDERGIDQLMLKTLVKSDFRHAPASLDVLHGESYELYKSLLAAQEPGSDRSEMLSLCAKTIASLRSTPGKNEAIKVSRIRIHKLEQSVRSSSRETHKLEQSVRSSSREIRKLKATGEKLQAEIARLESTKLLLNARLGHMQQIENSHWMQLGNRLKQSRSEPVSALAAVLSFVWGQTVGAFGADKRPVEAASQLDEPGVSSKSESDPSGANCEKDPEQKGD